MSATIVTGDDRTIVASLTIDAPASKSDTVAQAAAVAKAGAALTAAAEIKACLVNAATRLPLTPVYVIDPETSVDATAATVSVDIPAADTVDLDPEVATVLEIEMTDGAGKKLTWPDLGPILIKQGAIP